MDGSPRPGADGRLPQHRADHDLQYRLAVPRHWPNGRRSVKKTPAARFLTSFVCSSAGVLEPCRRDRALQTAHRARDRAHRRLMCNDLRNRLGEQQIRLEMTQRPCATSPRRDMTRCTVPGHCGASSPELRLRIGRALLGGGSCTKAPELAAPSVELQLAIVYDKRACGRSGRSLSRSKPSRSFSRELSQELEASNDKTSTSVE